MSFNATILPDVVDRGHIMCWMFSFSLNLQFFDMCWLCVCRRQVCVCVSGTISDRPRPPHTNQYSTSGFDSCTQEMVKLSPADFLAPPVGCTEHVLVDLFSTWTWGSLPSPLVIGRLVFELCQITLSPAPLQRDFDWWQPYFFRSRSAVTEVCVCVDAPLRTSWRR